MSELLKRLCKIAKIKPPADPDEVDQPFLQRLRKAIDVALGPDDDVWDALAEDPLGMKLQNWIINATKAVAAKTDIPDPVDAPVKKAKAKPQVDPEASDEDDEEGDDEVAKKAAKKAPAKKAAADKPAAKKAAEKEAPAKPAKKAAAAPAKKSSGEKPKKSLMQAGRELVLKKPEMKVDALVEKLNAMGYETGPSTVTTIRSDTRAIIKIIQALDIDVRKLDLDA